MSSPGWRVLVGLLIAATIWGWVDVRRRGYLYPEMPYEHKTDLTVYTEAGAAFFDGREPYEVCNPRGWAYLYPPMFALLLAPLSVLQPQNQVLVWFFLSLLFCWGCWRESCRILRIVRRDDPWLSSRWSYWFPWLGAIAFAVALLPTLNCLQRGQVGVIKLYLLLLGLRLILDGRTLRVWFAGGIVLAMPIVLKIVPVLPVGFLLFVQLIAVLRQRKLPEAWCVSAVRRMSASLAGLAAGLLLFFLLVPGLLLGWNANLRHLDTWSRFMLTKADDGGMDPRSGNSHSARNQSLQNAAYRLGNFTAYLVGDGPDDRLVENFDAPKMAMDGVVAERCLFLARAAFGLALLVLGVRLERGDGNRLNMAVSFALACVTMLVVSPVSRGHYFMLLAPATLLVPLWLDRRGRPKAATVLAIIPIVLTLLHYLVLPFAGRVGLLGLGTAAWLAAVMVIVATTAPSAPSVQVEGDADNPPRLRLLSDAA